MSQENDQSLQGVLNYTASSIMTMNCIVAGLASQLAAIGGNEAVQSATERALQVASAMKPAPGVGPDKEAIANFFGTYIQ